MRLRKSVRTSTLALSFSLAAGMTAVLARRFPDLRTPEAPHGIVSLELAFRRDTAEAVIASWRSRDLEAAARSSLLLDVAFIVCYSSALALLGALSARAAEASGLLSSDDAQSLSAAFGVGALSAGFCDLVENGGLWLELSGDVRGGIVGATSTVSAVKWVLIAGCAVGSLGILVGSAWAGLRRRP